MHDRLNHDDIAADLHEELNALVYEGMLPNRPVANHELHIFNHTDDVGAGYHFDLLWPPEMARAGVEGQNPEPVTEGGDLSLVLRLGQNCLHEIGMQTTLVETLCASNLRRKYVAENVRLEESTIVQSMETRAIVRQSLDALLESENSMPPTDADGLAMMKAAGFVRRRALAHGDNNSLIDALMLNLLALGLGVNEQNSSIEGRAKLAKVCRETLMDQRSRWETVQPSPTTELDWWRDSPAILSYLMGLHDGRSAYNFVVHCADRHLLQAVAPKFNCATTTPNSGGHRVDLYLYAHTTLTGREWHYDALVRTTQATAQHQSGEEGDADKKNPSQDVAPGHAAQYQTRRGERNGNNTPSGTHAQERQVSLEVSADAGNDCLAKVINKQPVPGARTGQKLSNATDSDINQCSEAPIELPISRSPTDAPTFEAIVQQPQWKDPQHVEGESCPHLATLRPTEGGDQMDVALRVKNKQDLPLPALVSQVDPATNPQQDRSTATAEAATAVDGGDLRTCLQMFLTSRSQASIRVSEPDVNLLRAKWNNMAEVGAQLQVWLGASVQYFEPTRKNAQLLAKQWMRFYTAYTHSPKPPEKETRTKRPHQNGDNAHLLNDETPATPQKDAAASCPRNKRPRRTCANIRSKDPKMQRSRATDAAEAGDGSIPSHARPAPKRRYTKKAPQDPEEMDENATALEQDEYWLGTWARQHGNPDPRAEKEEAIKCLASMLRPQPMLPHGMEASAPAFDLPNWHCAFKDCTFDAETYAELTDHLLHQHVAALRQVTDLKLPPVAWEQAGMEAYRTAISQVCQEGAPLAHAAIDRRCLRQFQEAKDGDGVGAAICFVCARRFPYVDTQQHPHGNMIQWRRLLNAKTHEFLNLSQAQAAEWFGYDAYTRNYAAQHEGEALEQLENELGEWQTILQFASGARLRLICCPEDKLCSKRCPPETTCPKCCAPICEFCWHGVTKEKAMPAAALANDMLVFYAPKMIYQQEVTFMELICASPCFTAMCCFSLEKRLLGDRALDQDAFMPRQRLAARGNATTFPLAWEDILQHLETAGAGAVPLPRTGVELAETVSVVLKSMQADKDKEGVEKVIHQARVRRTIVLQLLSGAKTRGHPAYKHINMEEATARAQTLPEDGIPEEIIAVLPYDNDLENVQRQKAATPVRDNLTLEAVAEELNGMCKPNAVVNEKSSAGIGDTNAQQVAALEALQRDSQTDAADSALTVTTGNRLLDQFQPWYFAFAFAYVFPFCTAMPDPPSWSAKPRYRRVESAPRMELEAWVRCMARRCEAQINRDWVFGFVSWNLLFRSAINLSRTVHTYGTPVYDERANKFRTLTAREIEAGAVQLVRALNAQYIDATGKPRPVNGDVSKLPYVTNLSAGARKLLKNMQHTARQLPGTQEARRQMRFEIEAMRIRYGVPLFVTFSPDESHQLLYIRMSRTRRGDPVRSASVWQEWQCGERDFPPLDDNRSLPISVESVQRLVPCWEQRRRVLARDPLASVDGFQTLALLLLKHIFGLHMCPQCPECATTWHPCIDTAGSSATVVGGVFGRVDAAYISIEAQKSTGSLHAHCQVFVQCLHQHTPLAEIFQLVESRLDFLREAYLQYNTHVVHMTYTGQTDEQIVEGVRAAEHTWPEHSMDKTMTDCPKYLRARALTRDAREAEQWAQTYLANDVVTLQYLKQHHYHPIDPETGERKPLRGCEKKDRPGVCKSDFPRIAWLCAAAKVLCPCELANPRLF